MGMGMYQAALEIREAQGDEANAAVARYNLAASLIGLGRHAEARPLLEAVLAFETERHGAEHELTLRARGSLADCMAAIWYETPRPLLAAT